MEPHFCTAPLERTTALGPLVALGYFVQQHDLLAPIRERVQFSQPTHCTDPVGALLDLAVGILAGCEVVAQVNTRLRPDTLLAQAWGRSQFAEQSTIARVLDSCQAEQIAQWRQANEALLRRTGQVYRHEFAHDWLRLMVDLTGLPASQRAEGSQKGYFAGKKT